MSVSTANRLMMTDTAIIDVPSGTICRIRGLVVRALTIAMAPTGVTSTDSAKPQMNPAITSGIATRAPELPTRRSCASRWP